MMDLIDRKAVMSTLGDLDLPDVHAALPVSLMLAVVKKALEPIPSVDAVPLDKLCEWLAGYAAPPKYAIDAVGGLREMADATKRAKAWEFALTSMERSGLFEVRDE